MPFFNAYQSEGPEIVETASRDGNNMEKTGRAVRSLDLYGPATGEHRGVPEHRACRVGRKAR